MDLNGKKLLVIGSDSGNVNIVNTARSMGIYTVCADGVTDRLKAPAKTAADEAWDVDYSDTDSVAEMCRKAGIDGVMAGYSEYRVLAACRISRALGLPFYGTEEQIQLTRNKRTFKDHCEKYGIPTPKDYCYSYPLSDEEIASVRYPVIVKPADYAGRKGISVCFTPDTLAPALEYAVSKSQAGNVIVEDYLDGVEFSSVYTVSGGKISLSAVNEKHITDDQEVKTGLCDFLISPATCYERYLAELDSPVRDFIRGIGIENGVVFFQGMVTPEKMYIFEMGYRINGNNDFYVIEKFNGLNFMKMLITHSITGDMGDDLSRDNPLYPRYACSLLFYAHGGTVGTFEYEKLLCHPDVSDVQTKTAAGATIVEDGSTGQCVLRMKLYGDTLADVRDTVKYAQGCVKLLDTEGRDMLFTPFDADSLLK